VVSSVREAQRIVARAATTPSPSFVFVLFVAPFQKSVLSFLSRYLPLRILLAQLAYVTRAMF
jgi:hypothetical protein